MASAKRTSEATVGLGVCPIRAPGVAVRAAAPGLPGTRTGASVPMGETCLTGC
ncbi:hypothetical protein ACTWPT_57495 [Nonomuraea sp. 3N208]|uniref:hypothetical protein n=1 Tax=Nonomuraea sp. 3N208 TaxID=3457421 RepID=UPI003FD22BD5